jgi:glucokinase
MPVIGIDLGGTKLASAIFSASGKISHNAIVSLEGRQGRAVGALIISQLQRLLEIARGQRIQIEGIGISVPGIADQKTGEIWAPNIPGWEKYPLRKEISSTLKDKSIRLTIDSDRACYILGETWQGAAKGCKDVIFLAVGTGIGAGILIDGKILRGANDIAGAIGWLALGGPFQTKYKSCGCFEHHSSGEGLAKVATELLASDKDYHGILENKKPLTAHDVFEAYKARDPIAEKTLQQAVEFWGMATANLVSLFNPEKIIFGGGVFGPAVQFIDDIYVEAKKWAQPISFKQVKLQASKLGGDAGLYGAACLALQAAKQNP